MRQAPEHLDPERAHLYLTCFSAVTNLEIAARKPNEI